MKKNPIYESLIDKSIGSMLSAIEIYNKPDFKYREETFAILAINSWELLLKARLLKLNNYRVNSIYSYKPYKNDVSYSSSNDPVNDPINDPINLTERQKLILQMFSEDKSLSRERLCEKTNLSDATAKREIAFLKKTGYLERIGSLKGGYWKVKRFRAIYAFEQIYLCFLLNVFLITIKYHLTQRVDIFIIFSHYTYAKYIIFDGLLNKY